MSKRAFSPDGGSSRSEQGGARHAIACIRTRTDPKGTINARARVYSLSFFFIPPPGNPLQKPEYGF